MTNIRNLDSPFWRSALNNVERRCIVPVTRFCEWTAEPDPVTKRKRKVWFGLHPPRAQEPLFAFAGLWRPGEGGPYMAFLTCDANALVGAVHPKAMPVMLRAARRADVARPAARKRLRPCAAVRGRRHADHQQRVSATNREHDHGQDRDRRAIAGQEEEEGRRASRRATKIKAKKDKGAKTRKGAKKTEQGARRLRRAGRSWSIIRWSPTCSPRARSPRWPRSPSIRWARARARPRRRWSRRPARPPRRRWARKLMGDIRRDHEAAADAAKKA